MVFIIPTPNELFKSLTKEGWRIRGIVVERGIETGKTDVGIRWIESSPDEQAAILSALRRENKTEHTPTVQLAEGYSGN